MIGASRKWRWLIVPRQRWSGSAVVYGRCESIAHWLSPYVCCSVSYNGATVGIWGEGVLNQHVNTLRPKQYGQHFPDNTFKRLFLNENVWILLKISLTFVPKVWINNISSLVQIMAWRRPGDKPLSEPMMDGLSTHICIPRPQWVNSLTAEISLRSF